MYQKEWATWKRQLTNAKKAGPETVITAWKTFEAWCTEHNAWPDWWADFQRAADDAQLEINRTASPW